MPWAAWAVETMTGSVGPRIPLAGSCSATVTLNGIDDWSLGVDDKWFDEVDSRWWSRWRGAVVIAHTCDLLSGWQPVCFGPVADRPAPDNALKPSVSTLTGKGLRQMLTMRLVTGTGDWTGNESMTALENSVATFTGMSLGTIQEELVKLGVNRKGGFLPITYDPALRQDNLAHDDGHTRNYTGFNVSNNSVEKLITDLANCDGGPDFMLRPQLSTPDDGQWRVSALAAHGMEGMPQIPQASQLTWDATALDGVVVSMSVTQDTTAPSTRAWAIGAGTDAAALIVAAQNDAQLADGMPLMETVASYTSVVNADPLQAHANADLKAGETDTPEVTLVVRGDASGAVIGTWQVGDRVKLTSPNRRDFDGGDHLMTITKAQYDLTSELVTVSLQEDQS